MTHFISNLAVNDIINVLVPNRGDEARLLRRALMVELVAGGVRVPIDGEDMTQLVDMEDV